MYELALISVLVAGGYWGVYFVRQDALCTYGVMQLGSAALCGLGLVGHRYDVDGLGIAGAIGVGGGTCLLIVGPIVRGFARRMAAAERFGLADRLLDVAEVLAPGSGVSDEKALLGAMREIRDGNIEDAVGALTAAKQRAPADARLAIDERIAMLYLTAYRWDEAIAHAEANLWFAAAPQPESPSLRRALGVAPPVWVELLGAYGYTGDLDRAAQMLARLEDVCAGRDDAAIWLHRGRLMFLAHAGRVSAVQTLINPRRSRHMSRAARTYWLAVAHERRGDGAAAGAAYAKARARSRGRPRVLIDQALARLANLQPVELGPDVTELVARVEAAPPPAVIQHRPHGPRATWLLCATLVAVAAAIALWFGESSDVGVLMRGGAMVRGLVRGGEIWRLVSCVFVHVGGLHLLVNVIGLWFLGRLAEELFGSIRTLAVFALSGVAGAIASYLASPAGVSAGASGAILGLLGAVFVELTWQRQRHRAAWSRGMWGGIAVVAIAQIGVGFLYPITDQWAHGVGLAAGAVLGIALSPHARWTRLAGRAAVVIAIAFGAAVGLAAVMVARTSIADSLGQAPQIRHTVGDLAITAPASWQTGAGEVYDPDAIVIVRLARAGSLPGWLADEQKRAAGQFDQVAVATDHVVVLPAGWDGVELAVSAPIQDPVGGRVHYRIVVGGDGATFASVYVPETVARAAPRFFTELLASIR